MEEDELLKFRLQLMRTACEAMREITRLLELLNRPTIRVETAYKLEEEAED